jgi:hypothetical protein
LRIESPGFKRDLRRIHTNVQEVVPQFEGWFRRKAFDEPLQQCTDQNWIARYNGARQTLDRLTAHADVVRRACPRYQVDLYEHLLVVVNSYSTSRLNAGSSAVRL